MTRDDLTEVHLLAPGLIPLHLTVFFKGDAALSAHGGWNVVQIDAYSGRERRNDQLIGEDFWPQLPESARMAVYGLLNEWEHRLWMRRQELAAVMSP